jgi:hypothetical protein
MTLTVAEIERWDPEAIREVFHAATARGNIAVSASSGLASLPVFHTWGGEAAESAKESIGQTRRDLDAHGQEAFAVASAASAAADGVERVRGDLNKLKDEAHSLGMEIDPATNAVVPAPGSRMLPQEVMLKQMQLQPKLDAIIADANHVDANLARAIDMADGSVPIPGNPVPTPPAPDAQGDPPFTRWDGPPPAGHSDGTGYWAVDTTRPSDTNAPLPVPPSYRSTAPCVRPDLLTGPSSGLLTVGGSNPQSDEAFGADLQNAYKFRVSGTQFSGITQMVQLGDGKWYQAQWQDYQYEMNKFPVLQGSGQIPAISVPVGMFTNEWTPVSLSQIGVESAKYPGQTLYLPNLTGGAPITVVDGVIGSGSVVPVMTRGD